MNLTVYYLSCMPVFQCPVYEMFHKVVGKSLGNFRSEYEYDHEYEFSVLSTRTLKNVDLET